MLASVLVSSTLVLLMVGRSIQDAFPQAPRATGTYQGGGGEYQGDRSGSQATGGYQGGRGGSQATGGYQGGRGGSQAIGGYQGGRGLGSDPRYGFNIVDTPDRYGYEANYPGGRASFYLLGQNRGPGQQGSRGYT